MKYIILFFVLFTAGALAQPYQPAAIDTPTYSPSFIIGQDADNGWDVVGREAFRDSLDYEFNTIADLRASTDSTSNLYCRTLGYYAAGDGGDARYYWNSTSTATDDSGSVIKSQALTGRWFLMPYGGTAYGNQFGMSSSLADNRWLFYNAVDFANDSGYVLNISNMGKLTFGGVVASGASIEVDDGFTLLGYNTTIFPDSSLTWDNGDASILYIKPNSTKDTSTVHSAPHSNVRTTASADTIQGSLFLPLTSISGITVGDLVWISTNQVLYNNSSPTDSLIELNRVAKVVSGGVYLYAPLTMDYTLALDSAGGAAGGEDGIIYCQFFDTAEDVTIKGLTFEMPTNSHFTDYAGLRMYNLANSLVEDVIFLGDSLNMRSIGANLKSLWSQYSFNGIVRRVHITEGNIYGIYHARGRGNLVTDCSGVGSWHIYEATEYEYDMVYDNCKAYTSWNGAWRHHSAGKVTLQNCKSFGGSALRSDAKLLYVNNCEFYVSLDTTDDRTNQDWGVNSNQGKYHEFKNNLIRGYTAPISPDQIYEMVYIKADGTKASKETFFENNTFEIANNYEHMTFQSGVSGIYKNNTFIHNVDNTATTFTFTCANASGDTTGYLLFEGNEFRNTKANGYKIQSYNDIDFFNNIFTGDADAATDVILHFNAGSLRGVVNINGNTIKMSSSIYRLATMVGASVFNSFSNNTAISPISNAFVSSSASDTINYAYGNKMYSGKIFGSQFLTVTNEGDNYEVDYPTYGTATVSAGDDSVIVSFDSTIPIKEALISVTPQQDMEGSGYYIDAVAETDWDTQTFEINTDSTFAGNKIFNWHIK